MKGIYCRASQHRLINSRPLGLNTRSNSLGKPSEEFALLDTADKRLAGLNSNTLAPILSMVKINGEHLIGGRLMSDAEKKQKDAWEEDLSSSKFRPQKEQLEILINLNCTK